MYPDCNARYMCRQCRKIHPNSHLNEFEDLEEILSGRLADDIHKNLQATNQQIEEQERISQNNSHTLITSIEGHFNQIQNHIMQKLNDTRELIIADIKNKFKENVAIKQEIQNHSNLIIDNYTTASSNNFSNVHQLNNLITSLCNAQILRTKINNDPELQTLQRGDLASSYFSMLNRLIDHFRIPFDKLCNELTNAFQINRNPYGQLSGTSSIPRIGANIFENFRFEPPSRLSVPKGIRQPETNIFADKNAYPLFNTIFSNQGGFGSLGSDQNGLQRFNIGQPDLSASNTRIPPTLLTPHNSINPQGFSSNQPTTNPSPFKLQPEALSSNLMKAAQEQLQLRAPQNSMVYDPNAGRNPPSNPRSSQPTPSRLASNLFQVAQTKPVETEEVATEPEQPRLFVNQPAEEEVQIEEAPVEIVREESNQILIEDEGDTEEIVETSRSTMHLEVEEVPKENPKKSVSPFKIIEIMQKANQEADKRSANSKAIGGQSSRDLTSQVTFAGNSQQLYDPEESVKPYLNNQRGQGRRDFDAYNPEYNRENTGGYQPREREPTTGYTPRGETPGNPNPNQRRSRETIERRGYLDLKDINVSAGIEYIEPKAELAIGGSEGKIQIWNMNPREPISTLRAHNGEVFVLRYIKEKGLLLSGGADGEIGIWDTKNRYKNVGFYKKHDKQPVYCLEYLTEYDEIVSAGEDGVLRFWQVDKGSIHDKGTVTIPNAKIYSVCYLKNENILLAGTDKGVIHVVSLSADDKKLLLQRTNAHDENIIKMQFLESKGKKILVTGSYDGLIKVWEIKEDGTLDLTKRLGQPGTQVMGFVVLQNQGLIVSSHNDGHIRLWRGTQGNDRMLLSKQDDTFGQNILYFKGHHGYDQMLTGNRKMVKMWSLNFENINLR